MHDIQTELSKRILILDGAMGTMLQRKGLQGNSESFNLTNPKRSVRYTMNILKRELT